MRVKIGIRHVQRLRPNSTIWDSSVIGFGARRQQGVFVSYILMYRTAEGRQRLYTIGKHGGPWVPETARKEAQRLLGEVSQGRDPAEAKSEKQHALTVSALCDQYLEEATNGLLLTRRSRRPKKPSTLATDRQRIEGQIKPLLGRRPVASVTRRDVEVFMNDVISGKCRSPGGRGTASRTVGLLGAIFTYAERRGLIERNPVRGVIRPADKPRTRRLSDAEYRALGRALSTASLWPPAIAAIKFLVLTGWRRGEVAGLTWAEVDLDSRTAHLSDTKTGASMRPLSSAACEVLRGQALNGPAVFPPSRASVGPIAISMFWKKLGLPRDMTPHTLRHSFASLAARLGYSDHFIAACLGHKVHSMTAGYVHLRSADEVLLAAADKVAEETLTRMGG